jgi:hypothetical protein
VNYGDLITDFLPVLPSVPEGGMLYYLQTECTLRGRRHQNTFFMLFTGGEKSVPQFYADNTTTIMHRLLLMQSWEVFMYGYTFVKLFPPPYVIQFFPVLLPGFWFEPAAENKHLAIMSAKTEQSGHKSRGRKFLFGMPASWVSGNQLTNAAMASMSSRIDTWNQLYTPSYPDWPYVMGLSHRYVNGVYHSPLNPINFWPYERMYLNQRLVKHRHPKRSSRWPHIP